MTYQTAVQGNSIWGNVNDLTLRANSFENFSLGQQIKNVVNEWTRMWRVGKTIKSLNRLDDKTLKDIGIERSEIINVAHAAIAARDQFNREGK
jgi:uncharacterized protein YjiS (DUF1127 family)